MQITLDRPARLRLAQITAALSGLTAILLLRRSPGIIHDSILYLGQVLSYRDPAIFSKDIFFLHGSQDNYTLFPLLIKWIFSSFEPIQIVMWGTLAGLLLFTTASWYLVKHIIPPAQQYMVWMGILCFPKMYGYDNTLSYAEQFFTTRIFSEPLCLLAIAFIAQRRWVAMLVCLIAAGLLHPLQTLAALPLIWIWLVMENRRWLHSLWLIIPIMLLALAGVQPLDGLIHQADAFWLMAMKLSPQLFITSWGSDGYIYLVFDVFILFLAGKQEGFPLARWSQAALIALILGMAGSLLLVDVLHLILPTGLQLWRTHWPAHWFAMAALTLFFIGHWQKKQWLPFIVLLLTALLAWSERSWAWIGTGIIYYGWPLINQRFTRIKPLLLILFSSVLGLLCIKYILIQLKFFTIAEYNLALYPLDYYLLLFPPITLSLVLLGIYAWHKVPEQHRYLLISAVLPLLLWSIVKWDTRSDTQRFIDGLFGQSTIFSVAIPEAAQVYWNHSDPLLSWYVLKRANFYCIFQQAGEVFNRETAVEGYKRWQRVAAIHDTTKACQETNPSTTEKQISCEISEATLYSLCRPAQAADESPPPDYFILPFELAWPALGTWSIHNNYNGELSVRHHLYSCEDTNQRL